MILGAENYVVVNQLDQPLVFRGLQSGTNRPVFSFTTRKRFALNTFDSRWQIMFGVR